MDETLKKVMQLKPIDDIFFEKIIEDKNVCEEILRVILEDDKESSQLGECSVIKHNKVNKKSWWRRIFRK